MILASVIVFTVAAVYGLWLAKMFFSSKTVTIPVVLGHGIIAATGLVLALIAIIPTGFKNISGIPVALFVIAAVGGIVLLLQHITKGAPSAPLIAIHALAAWQDTFCCLYMRSGVKGEKSANLNNVSKLV